MQCLPVSDFEWMQEEEIQAMTAEWVQSIAEDAGSGFIFEVDMFLPNEYHEMFSDYSLAPEKIIGVSKTYIKATISRER